MKVVVQRVSKSCCLVNDELTGSIDNGLLLLVGFKFDDTVLEVEKIAKKISNLRIFDDKSGKMNLSIKDVCGKILSISQFTLYASTSSGNRPSFVHAMNGADANVLYDTFNQKLREYGLDVETGVFGADMKVSLTNYGPVTIIMEENHG